jgi:hypothetical protein
VASKTQYWLVDDTGTYARAEGVEERDRLLARGYELAEEPTESQFVWARYEGIEAPAKIPANTLKASWPGWEPSVPDEPASPFNAPAGGAAPVSAVEADTSTTTKAAGSGAAKNSKE